MGVVRVQLRCRGYGGKREKREITGVVVRIGPVLIRKRLSYIVFLISRARFCLRFASPTLSNMLATYPTCSLSIQHARHLFNMLTTYPICSLPLPSPSSAPALASHATPRLSNANKKLSQSHPTTNTTVGTTKAAGLPPSPNTET